MKTLLSILFLGLLIACGNPKDTPIPSDMNKWDTELKPAVEKLKEEEKKLLAAYLFRVKLGETLGGSKMLERVTVGQAIEEQKKWAEEQARKEAEAKALKERLEKERAETLKQIDDILTVTVLKLKLVKEDYREQQLITLGLQNKSSRDIRGVKGGVKFIDMFDKEVGQVSFSYTDGLKAGATARWTGLRDYNQFIPQHRAVANLEEGKYTSRFVPETLVFEDGTKLNVKE